MRVIKGSSSATRLSKLCSRSRRYVSEDENQLSYFFLGLVLVLVADRTGLALFPFGHSGSHVHYEQTSIQVRSIPLFLLSESSRAGSNLVASLLVLFLAQPTADLLSLLALSQTHLPSRRLNRLSTTPCPLIPHRLFFGRHVFLCPAFLLFLVRLLTYLDLPSPFRSSQIPCSLPPSHDASLR